MKYFLSLLMMLFLNNLAIGQVSTIFIQMSKKGGGDVTGHFIVEDEIGRSTGRDLITNIKYEEIPSAQYGGTGLDDHESPGAGVTWNEFWMVPGLKGTYRIRVNGAEIDSFDFDIEMGRDVGTGADFDFFSSTSPCSVTEYEIFYDPDTTVTLSAKLIIGIDIKPDDDPNSINPKSKGVIPVAILTDPNFDATTVDVSTLVFGPGGAQPKHNGHIENVDGDGDDDLMLHFNTQDTGIQCGDTGMSLSGAILGGQAIEGSDSIVTVGCK